MGALTRIPRNASGVLTHTFYLGEDPTDSTVTVTYAVTDANGEVIADGDATSAGTDTGQYTFTLAAQTALQAGTIAFTATIGGTVTIETDFYEIVDGFYFTLAQGRASDSSLADETKYPTADLDAKRLEVEVECETICDRAFVPRYERVILDGTGSTSLLLRMTDPNRSVADIRSIRSISVAPAVDETFVDYTAGEIAAVTWTADGTLRRTDNGVFYEGVRNVVVEFEYGLDRPPADLIPAALTRLRSRLNFNKNGIPDRASSFTVSDGGTFRLDMPGAYKTGLPEVDAVYSRYSRRTTTGANGTARGVAASRTLNYDPQHRSLFHGGVR